MDHIGIRIDLDKNGRVLDINENALRYIKESFIPEIGYPRGSINEKDLIILIDSLGVDTGNLWDSFLLKAGAPKLYSREPFIAVAKYMSNDHYPLIKVKDLDIETIYDGSEISVSIDERFANVCFEGIAYRFKLTPDGKQLLILRNGRVVYYIDEDLEISDENLEFRGRLLYSQVSQKLHYKELFDGSISNIIEKILSSFETIGLAQDNGLAMGYMLDQIGSSKCIYLFDRDHLKKGMLTLGGLLERYDKEIGYSTNGIDSFRGIVGKSQSIQAVKRLLGKVAPTSASILLTGESGCGKTLFAKEIHQRSNRSTGPFVVINCAAIPESLIESELFGYDEGAFTGAKKSGRKGFFEQGNGGTIFLDEIGELPLSSQGRLLEVLQNQSFYRVGGNDKVRVDVRIIAATNQDLEQLVFEKRFRKDLYYRLNVFPVVIPPLRERVGDIEHLAKKFIPEICKRLDVEPILLSDEAIDILTKHSWLGNVRELENVIEKACILCEGKIINKEHLSIDDGGNADLCLGLKTQLEREERRIINEAIQASDFNKQRAASLLKIGRTTLFEKMKKYGIGG